MGFSLEYFQQQYIKYKGAVFALIIALSIVIILLFFNSIIAFSLLACCLLYQIFFLRKLQKTFASQFTQENIQSTICKKINSIPPKELDSAVLNENMLVNANLMPMAAIKNNCLLRWGISGKYENYIVKLCDAAIAQPFKLSYKGKTRMHFNSGVWVHIELPKQVEQNWRMLNENSVPTPIRMDYFSKYKDLQLTPFSEPTLNAHTALYCHTNSISPTNSTLKKIAELTNYTTGYVAISVYKNNLDIFVRGRFLARPISMAKKPTQQQLDLDPFPELAYCFAIADTIIER